MLRNRRSSNSKLFQLVQQASRISFGVLLVLTIASGVFVYHVSPLRDPAFQPNSANAGSLLPWLQGMREGSWVLGATVLAGLLSVNSVLLLWQSNRGGTTLIGRWQQEWSHPITRLLLAGIWLSVAALLFAGIKLLFIGYLLAQWLVD